MISSILYPAVNGTNDFAFKKLIVNLNTESHQRRPSPDYLVQHVWVETPNMVVPHSLCACLYRGAAPKPIHVSLKEKVKARSSETARKDNESQTNFSVYITFTGFFPTNTIAIRTIRYLEEKILCYQHNSVSRARKKTEATTQWKKTKPSSPCELVSPTSSPLYTPRKTPWTPLLVCKNDNVALTKLSLLTPKRVRKYHQYHHLITTFILRWVYLIAFLYLKMMKTVLMKTVLTGLMMWWTFQDWTHFRTTNSWILMPPSK